ncbi:MAG: ABC transporter permease [candidate division WOR-3 bacterium]
MLRRVYSIALNTFRESLRDRVLLTLIVFAVVAMGGAKVVQPVALGEADKIVKDIGLSAITFFSVLIAILVGGRIVYREVEKRTVYLVLARPVRRREFVLGKYFGLLAVLYLSVLAMTAVFFVVLAVSGVRAPLALLWSVVMTCCELALITALAVFFSTFVTPIAGSVFTMVLYFIGHSTLLLKQLAAMSPSSVVKAVGLVLYYVLPNLENFNIRGDVVHSVPLDPRVLLLSAVYAAVYSLTLLLIATGMFRRKDF